MYLKVVFYCSTDSSHCGPSLLIDALTGSADSTTKGTSVDVQKTLPEGLSSRSRSIAGMSTTDSAQTDQPFKSDEASTETSEPVQQPPFFPDPSSGGNADIFSYPSAPKPIGTSTPIREHHSGGILLPVVDHL